jgi:hypothetical protein
VSLEPSKDITAEIEDLLAEQVDDERVNSDLERKALEELGINDLENNWDSNIEP